MRILDAIVFPSPALMAALDPQIADRCAVSPQVVRDQSLGDEGVFLEKLAHQFQRGMLVSLGLDQHVEDLAFGVDGAPEIEHSAIDFQIDLVKTLGRVRLGPALSQVRCDERPEMIRPASERLIRDPYRALREQIFDVAQTPRTGDKAKSPAE